MDVASGSLLGERIAFYRKRAAEAMEQAKTADLPEDLREQIDVFLEENPELPWDEALARIISGENAPEPGRTLLDESTRKEAN